jgi:hypothetical protein
MTESRSGAAPDGVRSVWIFALLALVVVLGVGAGFVAEVSTSQRLSGFEQGTHARAVIAEMGPPDADYEPTVHDMCTRFGGARVLFYDSSPWWFDFGVSGVDICFDREHKLLETYLVME